MPRELSGWALQLPKTEAQRLRVLRPLRRSTNPSKRFQFCLLSDKQPVQITRVGSTPAPEDYETKLEKERNIG